MSIFEQYIHHKIQKIESLLGEHINTNNWEINFIKSISSKNEKQKQKLQKFFNYYDKITIDEMKISLSEFRINYSLRGISDEFIKDLEEQKNEIISSLKSEKIQEVYIDHFYQKKINKRGLLKNLGSFFSKLTHTILPAKYTALDNPVKNFFELKDESFFVSFLMVSRAYENFSRNPEHESIILNARKKLKEILSEYDLKIGKYSDIKILDLIFWQIANFKKLNP